MTDDATRVTAYLGLGSNLGDRLSAMRRAVSTLDDQARVQVDFETGVASLYETSPVGGPPGQSPFLNSVVRIFTTLSAPDLLDAVMSIETSLGRVRRRRWGERAIDIDLLLYDNLTINDPNLSLPHPHLHERRFVLEPLARIAGEVLHPTLKLTIGDLARRRRDSASQAVRRVAGPEWCDETVAVAIRTRAGSSPRGDRFDRVVSERDQSL